MVLYQIGSSLTSPEKTIEKLQTAIVEKDSKTLIKLITTKNPRLEIREKDMDGFIKFMDENPMYLSDLVGSFENQAIFIEKRENTSFEDSLLILKNTGQTAFVFDKYQFHIQPFYMNIATNYEGAKISLNVRKLLQQIHQI